MRRLVLPVSLLALTLLATPGATLAQDTSACEANDDPWHYLRSCARSLFPDDTASLTVGLKEAFDSLKSPAMLNSALGEFESLTGTAGPLGRLNTHFVNVHETGGATALGMRYDWQRHIARTTHQQGSTHWGLSSALESKGLLTHEAAKNPEDLLHASFNGHVYLASGGKADPTFLDAHVESLVDSIQKFETSAALRASDSYKQFMGAIWDSLSTQVYVTAGPEARFEADQAFDQTQWAYGARIGFDVKAWNPNSFLAKANVFDWPAAVVRLLTGADSTWSPSGVAIPTAILTYHRVDPRSNPTRETLAGLDAYGRWALDVTYRGKLAQSKEGPLWLEATYRRHKEVEPTQAVHAAGLHTYSRLLLVLEAPGGFVASWSTGSLPLDDNDSDHFGVGFRFHF